jgi:hypothetical protein
MKVLLPIDDVNYMSMTPMDGPINYCQQLLSVAGSQLLLTVVVCGNSLLNAPVGAATVLTTFAANERALHGRNIVSK